VQDIPLLCKIHTVEQDIHNVVQDLPLLCKIHTVEQDKHNVVQDLPLLCKIHTVEHIVVQAIQTGMQGNQKITSD